MIRPAALLALPPLLTAWLLTPGTPDPAGPPAGAQDPQARGGTPAGFAEQWYRGEAELTRYELHVDRYGEERVGDAVLVFVTEDFLPDEQVKYEGGDPAGAGAVKVLKLNHLERFTTGIYDYSLMRSVFTPVDGAATLKVTASVQDWCGHVWQQLNRRDGGWRYRLFSYFQREADRDARLAGALLEDEVWTRIRLRPDELPRGRVEVVPGSFDARLRHREPVVRKAEATLEDLDGDRRRYTLRYPDLDRSLAIEFEAAFPHRILGWEERWKEGGAARSARARATNRLMSPYWSHHGVGDAPLRKQLGLR
ncbi:MAG: hypothetical protein R3F30_08175 [Planctomycetota bacterium]